jgi:hypothetical protein
MNIRTNQKGTVLLFTVIILGLAAVSAFVLLSRSSIDAFVDSQQSAEAIQMRADLQGCADELLIQLQADSEYSGNEINTIDALCGLVLTTPEEGEREADILVTSNQITRIMHIEMTVDPVAVTLVSEE